MNYYRRHIGDYLRDAAHLSLLEHGVYTRLLDIYYTRESRLPCADKAARLIGARSQEERDAVDAVLSEFFVQDDDGCWMQKRCEREIEASREKAERNREVGKLGGRPRKSFGDVETEMKPTGNPDGFQEKPKRNPSQEPIANSQEPEEEREVTSPPSSRARAGRSPTGSRIPAGFPTETELGWASAERPDLDAMRVAATFRDHWTAKPGKDGRKLDWPATWRNWVRSERPPARAAPLQRRSTSIEAGLALAGYTRSQPEIIDVFATESAAPRLG